ncbi:MAG TPA: CocE/NonD family hydrolase [Gaiellaceae bacterium]|nr:CocE/NonD family hydrolase [Gaiellaceae bacterium]
MLTLLLSALLLGVATPQPVTVTASDGVPLACSIVEPDGTPPAGGWPGVILFHGLGGSHADMEPIAAGALAPAGYASLECDARGTGASGGQFGLDGPRENQDARDLFTWFAARSEVSDTQIGALGISLGGGAVWNATAAGVPFKAIVPVITWTNLQTALAPQGVAKTELVALLAALTPASRWDPDLLAASQTLAQGTVTAAAATAAAARSPLAQLSSISVPTLLIQGRHDFLFDIDQAEAAYRELAGPKELYLGDLGHVPAPSPPAEQPTYLGLAVKWFDKYLKGSGAVGTGVVLAHDPWDGKVTSYAGLPPTKRVTIALPGSKTIGPSGKVVRSVRITGGPHETFGDSTVTVRYSGMKSWDHLVAVLSASGIPTAISTGACTLTGTSGVAQIHFMNESVRVPAGAKFTITLAATSGNAPVYATGVAAGASVTIGRETLALSALKRAVSK